nr:MAG TPA: hypothetical protein [Caudoviricetes sp.]
MIKSINLSSLTSSLISSSSFSFLLLITPNHPCPFFIMLFYKQSFDTSTHFDKK